MENAVAKTNIIGDPNGMALWNLMSQSQDEYEKDRYNTLINAATKFKSIWFTDVVTQRLTKNAQTVWGMRWDDVNQYWNITKLHIPDGAPEVSDRINVYKNGSINTLLSDAIIKGLK